MSRLSQWCLLFLSLLSSSIAFVMGDEEPTVPSETEAPSRPRVKISPDAYPYGKPKEATGVKFSEYQALAVSPWILYLILTVFVAGAGFVIYKIFESQQLKEQKKLEKQKLKEEKKQSKGSKKGSRKAE